MGRLSFAGSAEPLQLQVSAVGCAAWILAFAFVLVVLRVVLCLDELRFCASAEAAKPVLMLIKNKPFKNCFFIADIFNKVR